MTLIRTDSQLPPSRVTTVARIRVVALKTHAAQGDQSRQRDTVRDPRCQLMKLEKSLGERSVVRHAFCRHFAAKLPGTT
jgi:hypothetical protein